jgi:HAMP domain-containing protein
VFQYFINRAICREALDSFGAGLDDALRRRLLVRVSLRQKLMVSVTGVSVVVVVFAMLLATVHSGAPVERNATRVQAAFLEVELGPMLPGDVADVRALAERGRALGIADDVLLLDVERGDVLVGDAGLLSSVEVDVVRGAASGQSTDVDSTNAFAWRRVPGSPVAVVAVTGWRSLRGEVGSLAAVFVGLLVMSALVSFGLAFVLSGDVGTRSRELTEAAARVASGDLRATVRMEAEDELGDLARAFGAMTEALRAAVSGVVDAADQVERAAEDIASIASVVSHGAQEQNQGVQRAVTTMERINEQVSGISSSAQELNTLVEESWSRSRAARSSRWAPRATSSTTRPVCSRPRSRRWPPRSRRWCVASRRSTPTPAACPTRRTTLPRAWRRWRARSGR